MNLNPYIWQGIIGIADVPAANLDSDRLVEIMGRSFSAVRDVAVPKIFGTTVTYRVRLKPLWFTLLSFGLPFGGFAWYGYQEADPVMVLSGFIVGLATLYAMSGIGHTMWRMSVRSWLRRGSLPPAM